MLGSRGSFRLEPKAFYRLAILHVGFTSMQLPKFLKMLKWELWNCKFEQLTQFFFRLQYSKRICFRSGSAFRKNPICRDLNFNCSVGLTPSKPWNEFTISFEGLIKLVDHLWSKFSSTDDSDDDFEMLISKSCFSYYIWQHMQESLK